MPGIIRITRSSINAMNTNNYAPKVVGIMFVVLIVTHMASVYFFDPYAMPRDIAALMRDLSNNPANGYISFFLLLTSHLGAIVLAVMLYIVLSAYDRSLALLAMAFRLTEAVIGTYGNTNMLTLFSLSDRARDAADLTMYHFSAQLLYSASYSSFVIAAIAFAIGSFIFSYLFFKSRFVPRFISIFGMAASILVLLGMILDITTVGNGSVILGIWLIMMVSELMYGFWLPIKGIRETEN